MIQYDLFKYPFLATVKPVDEVSSLGCLIIFTYLIETTIKQYQSDILIGTVWSKCRC